MTTVNRNFWTLYFIYLIHKCAMQCVLLGPNGRLVRDKSLDRSQNWMLMYHRNAFTNKFIQFKIQSKLYSIQLIKLHAIFCLWMTQYARYSDFSPSPSYTSSFWNMVLCTTSHSNVLNCTPFIGRKLNSMATIHTDDELLTMLPRNVLIYSKWSEHSSIRWQTCSSRENTGSKRYK